MRGVDFVGRGVLNGIRIETIGRVRVAGLHSPSATTVSGAGSNNTSQYTGRENDSDGLYFYRARYYHPVMSRFVSEDPIGFGGGDPGLYSYARGAPTNFSDPSGQLVQALVGCAVGSVLSGGGYWLLSGRKAPFGDVGKAALLGCGLGVGVSLGLVWLFTPGGAVAARAAAAAGVAVAGAAVPAAQRIANILMSYGVQAGTKVQELSGTLDDAVTLFSLLAGAADLEAHPGTNPNGLSSRPGDNIFVGLRPNSDPGVHTVDVHRVPGFQPKVKIKFK